MKEGYALQTVFFNVANLLVGSNKKRARSEDIHIDIEDIPPYAFYEIRATFGIYLGNVKT